MKNMERFLFIFGFLLTMRWWKRFIFITPACWLGSGRMAWLPQVKTYPKGTCRRPRCVSGIAAALS